MGFKKQRRRDKRKSASNQIKATRDRRPTVGIVISSISLVLTSIFSYQAFIKNRRDNIQSNFISSKQECLTGKNRVDFEYRQKWTIESESNTNATGIICTLYLKDRDLTNRLAPKLIVEQKNVGTKISQSEFVQEAKQDIQKLSSNNAKIISTKFDVIFDNDKGYEIEYLVNNSDNKTLKRLEVGKLDNGRVFSVTYSAKEKEHKKYEEEIRQIIDSIDIIEIE